ncbi:MAG: TrkA family potassium uptake protein [Spirochaetaceae bacterium]|jgi:trk system potassium uptake protein TrkA|nr:TrkA family potassium uptake protein [Spirochaetaceae bacterium]
MVKTFAVIGLGIFGRKVCEILTEKGGEVIAIDNTPSQVNRVKDFVVQAILLDSTDEESISNAPFDQVDAAIVAIGDNIEASILTTTLLKQLGVPYIISRAVNKTHYQVLKQIGADEVINIEEDQGKRVALNLIAPSVLDKVRLSKDVILSEMYLPTAYHKSKIASLDLVNKYNIQLSALRRTFSVLDSDGNTLRDEKLLFPDQVEELLEGDVLIIVGDEKNIEKFQKSGEV